MISIRGGKISRVVRQMEKVKAEDPKLEEAIENLFEGAADFCVRSIFCGGQHLKVYGIDGLISGNACSEYIIDPLMTHLRQGTMEEVYNQALYEVTCNSVALPCEDLEDAARKLVNGFSVVVFPGAGAIAYEVKTNDKRGPAPPQVENTVKGA